MFQERRYRYFNKAYRWIGGPGSDVSIATGYRLDGPGIKSRLGEIFRTYPDLPWGPPSLLYNGYRVFPGGVKSGRGVALTPHPLLVPWSRKSRAIPILPLWAVWPVQSLSACRWMHFTGSFPGVKSGQSVTLTPHLLLVPWSRKSRAIPLLPLWAVRPVESLSACRRVHFIGSFPG